MFFTAALLTWIVSEEKGREVGSQPSARWIECKVQPEMRKISYFTKEKCQFETRLVNMYQTHANNGLDIGKTAPYKDRRRSPEVRG
jgi:hypothetical protein